MRKTGENARKKKLEKRLHFTGHTYPLKTCEYFAVRYTTTKCNIRKLMPKKKDKQLFESHVFLHVMPCLAVKNYRRFEGSSSL